MKNFLKWLLRFVFRTRFFGLEKLKFAGPSIIMPNHASFLDAVFLYAYLPKEACFVINTEIAEKISPVLRWINHIKIDPLNPYSLKKIITVAKTGQPIVLFPEGRLTMTGGLMKVYNGIGLVAFRSAARIYPVIFLGTHLSKVTRIKNMVHSRWLPEVSIFAGEPYTLALAPGLPLRKQKKQVSDNILTILQYNMFKAREAAERTGNLFDKLLEAAREQGGGQLIEDVGAKAGYSDILLGSYAMADQLADTLNKEERVGVLLPNSIGHLVALFTLFYMGKTPAILNFSAGTANNLHCSEIAGLRTILTSRQFIEKGHFEELQAALKKHCQLIYLEDVKSSIGWAGKCAALVKLILRKKAGHLGELVLFTSGSESRPKGVVLSHKNILSNLNQIGSIIDYTPCDKMLNALPMFHSFGLTAGTFLPLFSGMGLFLYPTPLHYKIIPEIVYDRNITVMLGTPTFLSGYAKYAHPYDFYSMRYVLAGGEKLKDEVRQLWHEKFGLRVLEGYGVTEASPVLALNTPLFYKTGTVGRILPGIEWRLEAVAGIEGGGDILVKGPNMMQGYLLAGQGFVLAPAWYNCGDIVEVDEDGFVAIKSRLKRFAKISGEMVSLDGVEKVAENCFGIGQYAAINLPDTKRGEKIILYTTSKNATKQALREFISANKENLLAMPSSLLTVDKLPLLGNGKTDYVSLKALVVRDGE